MPKTIPKVLIYIPKDKGKPTVSHPWHVYFYYPIPGTGINGKGKKFKKFCFYKGLNRHKTVRERKQFAKALKQAVENLLHKGFNPFDPESTLSPFPEDKIYTLREALVYALENKRNEWKESTLDGTRIRMNLFLKWAGNSGIDGYDIRHIQKKHIVSFLNHISAVSSNTNVNNSRAALASLFTKLVQDDIIKHNFILDIPKRKAQPMKNKPFTGSQMEAIRKYLLEHEPYLYQFVKFLAYAFLREVEVTRLTVGDIDLVNDTIRVETKTERRATVRIIQLLKPTLEAMELQRYAPDMSLFSPSFCPGPWTAKERNKVDFFVTRFAKVKNAMGYGHEYGLYSFRHTFVMDLFKSYTNQGLTEKEAIFKMLPITRHTNETGLRNYLRAIGSLLPKDYGEHYTIEF